MKKNFGLLLIVFLLAGCSPVAQSMAVQLPEELIMLIEFAAMVAVTAGFKWLSSKLGGVNLEGQAAKIASAVASLVVIAVNYGLQLIPAAYDNWLNAVLSFLIVLLGGAGFYSLFLRRKPKLELNNAKKAK